MKTIVVTGGGSRVGKTTLAVALGRLLAGSRVAKLGTHPKRADKNDLYFPIDTPFAAVRQAAGDCAFLIIESGSILDDPQLDPDLVIFLPAPAGREDKPGSELRRARADLVRGKTVTESKRRALMERLEVDADTFSTFLHEVGIP